MRRAAAFSVAALLSVGGASTVMASTAGAQVTSSSTSSTSIPQTTSTTQAPGVVVTDFSVTLAGLGDITLSVDPTTREISNIVVTPLDGITVADPIAVHNGVQLDFTLADGTVRSIVVEIEGHHGQVRIEVEEETEDEGDDDRRREGPPAIEDRGVSAEHRNDDNGHRGRGSGIPTTTTTPPTVASSSNNNSTARPDSSDDRHESGSSRSGRSGSRD